MAVLAVAATIVLAIISRQPSSNSSQLATAKAFNRYANYILYGKDNNKNLDEPYNRWAEYELDKQLTHEDESFWKTATNLLNEAVESYSGSDDSVVFSMLKNYQQSFLFFRQYNLSQEPTEEDIFQMFYKDGLTAAKSYVDDLYAGGLGNDSTAVSLYSEAKIMQYQATIDYLELYRRAGCILSTGIRETCPNLDLANATELSTEIMNSEDEAEAILDDLERSLISDCWSISTRLGEEE